MSMRGNKPIKILTIPFHELDTWKLYGHKWIEHHAMDPEKETNTPELYTIWAQKTFFVEQAITINPFQTEYFFWWDFGAFRDININPVILESFPNSKYLEKNKIILQSVKDLEPSDKIKYNDGI